MRLENWVSELTVMHDTDAMKNTQALSWRLVISGFCNPLEFHGNPLGVEAPVEAFLTVLAVLLPRSFALVTDVEFQGCALTGLMRRPAMQGSGDG